MDLASALPEATDFTQSDAAYVLSMWRLFAFDKHDPLCGIEGLTAVAANLGRCVL